MSETIEVQVPVDGTVVDWDHKVQVNPVTGEVFDFNGSKIYDIPESPATSEETEIE